MEKRGLSDVITTVLIILLVLAAVIIIWAFVRPALINAGSQVTGECITLNLQPVSCVNYHDTNGVYLNTTVIIKRDAGQADLNKLLLVYQVNGQDSVVNASSDLPLELESKSYSSTSVGDATTFTVAGVVTTKGNSVVTCNEVDPRINCGTVTG